MDSWFHLNFYNAYLRWNSIVLNLNVCLIWEYNIGLIKNSASPPCCTMAMLRDPRGEAGASAQMPVKTPAKAYSAGKECREILEQEGRGVIHLFSR